MVKHNVLYVGAGSLATQVADLLPNWSGWALRRSSVELPAGLQWIAADMSNPQCPPDWPQTCPDYVVVTLVPAARSEQAYRQAYVEGVRHLLGWLHEQGQRPRRVLFVSSIGVYGQADGEWVDEHSATQPQRWSGQLMLEAEQLLFASGLPVTSVRLAGIYGGARRSFLERVRQGHHADGCSNRYTNRIHEQDAASLLAHLLQLDAQGQTLESVYLGVDDEPAEQAEVVSWLQQQLGVSSEAGLELKPAGSSKRCSNQLARRSGWQPQYVSYREGYAAMLAGRGR